MEPSHNNGAVKNSPSAMKPSHSAVKNSPSAMKPSPSAMKNSPSAMKQSHNGTRDTGSHKKGSSTCNETRLTKSGSGKKSRASRYVSVFISPLVDGLDIDQEEDNDSVVYREAAPFWCSHRFRLAMICFAGFLLLYAHSFSLSIAIVAMRSEFSWDKDTEGLVLSGFFYGYLMFQVAGGRLSEHIGPKRVIAMGMFPVSVMSLLTPVAAKQSPYLYIAVRVVIGMGESVMFPSMQVLWSKWAPPVERSRLMGFSYAGLPFGVALIFSIGGLLSDGPGWEYVFYLVGGSGVVWCSVWMWLVHDSPSQDPTMGEREFTYFSHTLGVRRPGRLKKTPWLSFLKSRAVWAIVVGHTCANYGTYMFLTKIPGYMSEVLHFDISSNGTLSMLPYICFWVAITLSGILADRLVNRCQVSVGNVRKLMSTSGTLGPAAVMVGLGYLDSTRQVEAVVLLCLAVGMIGFQFSGFMVNHGDIAPAFAGTLFGISNTVATIPGILSPIIVSSLTPNGTAAEWRNVFFVAIGVYVFGAMFYAAMAGGDVEPWAVIEREEVEEEPRVEGEDESEKEEEVRCSFTKDLSKFQQLLSTEVSKSNSVESQV